MSWARHGKTSAVAHVVVTHVAQQSSKCLPHIALCTRVARPIQYRRKPLAPKVLTLAGKMLLEWPSKTLFVPFGILRLAALHPDGSAWLADASNELSLDGLLERTSAILQHDPTPLVEVSALLFLVNAFAAQDAELAEHLCAQVATARGSAAIRSIVSHALAGGPESGVAQHCWAMCINLTLMLERSVPTMAVQVEPRAVAQQHHAAITRARAASAAVIQVVMQYAAEAAPDAIGVVAQQAHRTQPLRVLCNIAASGIIDRHASQFWASLGSVLQPDGATSTGPFCDDAVAQEEVQCLLRYREPVFEAW